MVTVKLNRLGIQIWIPERLRLFLVNCYRSAPVQNTRNALSEFYTYTLLRPYFQHCLSQRNQPLQYLFVMSPMRSGSSLLVHLLNSNPEIEGFGESHCNYSSHKDLEKLIYRTAVIQKSFDFQNASYVMDKMVRNHTVSNTLLSSKHSKFIFLLRDPITSFKSMNKLGQKCYGLRNYQSFEHWFRYYQERLDFLQNTAQQIESQERCLFIRYEDLLHKTQVSLQKLQDFLQTQAIFAEDYTVSKTTGILRYGDPSDVLKLGKISRQATLDRNAQLSIFTEEERALAYDTYQSCIDKLTQFSQTV